MQEQIYADALAAAGEGSTGGADKSLLSAGNPLGQAKGGRVDVSNIVRKRPGTEEPEQEDLSKEDMSVFQKMSLVEELD